MTDSTWKTLASAIATLRNSPTWLQEIGKMAFEEVAALPKLSSETPGSAACPHATENIIKPDYLDFLREQIRLEPRGLEWTAVLQARLRALEPFVDKKVIIADFYHKPSSAALYVDPETGELFHAEID